MIQKLNIRVTTLEQFRLYASEAFNGWFTLEKILEYITEPYVPRTEVTVGTLMHALIEFGPDKFDNGDGTLTLYDADLGTDQSRTYSKELLKPIIDWRETLSRAYVHECNVAKYYQFGDWNIRLSGKVDGIEGLRLKESKTKNKPPKREDYYRGIQWRSYLDMLPDAHGVDYNVFELKHRTVKGERHLDQIVHHKYKFDRYTSEPFYIRMWLEKFLQFIIDQNLVEYFQPEWLLKAQRSEAKEKHELPF